ncbi:MAG: tetratricopeptide (TPR) repeat protein [Gammaproteobacteria bacterium]|jgi:tetratricopeptide (TPR) repeat protein
MIKQLFLKTSLFLIFTSSSLASTDSSLLPMYGGEDRKNNADLLEKDNKFIVKTTRLFSGREHAAEGYVERGFEMYSQNNFDKAMQRFNQAWILNPDNAYVYLGYGLLYNNEKKSCKAVAMFMQAQKKGLNESGFLSDYAYTTTNCALTKENPLQKELFSDANDLHKQSSQSQNKALQAYAYYSWAKSYLLQNDLSNSQAMLEQSINLGGKVDAQFEQSLKERLVESK